MSDGYLLDVIDLIYAAAIEPAGWSAVLFRLAEMTGCIAGGLTIENPVTGSGTPITYFGFDPNHVQQCFDHFLPMNPLFAIDRQMQPGFVVTNEMVVDNPTFRKSEFYDGWARPQGLCSPISLVLHRQEGRYMPLTLVRPDGAGEVSDDSVALLKTLSPHLTRAMGVALKIGQLDLARRNFQTCLDQLPVGIVLLDANDRVLRTNSAAEAFFRQGPLDVRQGEIQSRSPTDAAIRRALAARRHARSEIIPDIAVEREGYASLVISVLPINIGEVSFDDERVATMLVIRSTTMRGAMEIGAFAAAHGLTAREKALLQLLATEGLSLADSAARLNIGLPTVKTHLQRTFDKTGTKRQSELLAKVFRSLLS